MIGKYNGSIRSESTRRRCNMKVLVDGDGCPVVSLATDIAKDYGIDVMIFCDTAHYIEQADAKVITVSKGSDAVDFRLVNEVRAGDILVTQDYGLAAMGLARGAKPINQNGLLYTQENIDQLLFTRHLGKEVRRKGGRTKGSRKRTKAQDEAFARAFRSLIETLLKNANIRDGKGGVHEKYN